jgi:hypothetical protein
MIIEIQVGPNLVCEMTGERVTNLVRFKCPDESVSPWLSQAVLERGLQVIAPPALPQAPVIPTHVQRTHNVVAHQLHQIPTDEDATDTYEPDEEVRHLQKMPEKTAAQAQDKIFVAQCANELAGLVKVKGSSKGGIPERDLVEICRRYVRLFRHPRESLRDALSVSIGFDPQRYDYFYNQVAGNRTP